MTLRTGGTAPAQPTPAPPAKRRDQGEVRRALPTHSAHVETAGDTRRTTLGRAVLARTTPGKSLPGRRTPGRSTQGRPTPVRTPSGRWGARLALAAAAAVPLAFLAIFFAWPVAHMIGLGFTSPTGGVDLSAFAEVFTRPRTWRIIALTLAQASAATIIAVGLGLPAAFVLYRRRFRGAAALRAFVSVPFVLPAVVVGVAFSRLLAPTGPLGALGLSHSIVAIVAALVFFNYSIVVRQVGTLWAALDPRPDEAARTLGASRMRAFRDVTLPALMPAIASSAALVFLFSATAFGVVLILGGIRYGTIETEIYVQTTQFLNLRAASVLSIAQLVVVAMCLWAGSRAQARRRAAVLGGTPGRLEPLSRADAMPAAVTALTLGVLALPLAALVAGALRTPSGWSLGNFAALSDSAGLNTSAWAALGASLRIAALATLVAVAVALLICIVLSRRPASMRAARALRLLDAAFMLPLGVSAVTVGFGFLVTLDRPPLDLRSAGVLIPLAQAVVAIPLVVRTVLPTLLAIDPRQREAAATLGAPPWRVFATVDLPVALRAAGLGAGFAFAVALGEFGATSFLARPDAPTLPVLIYRLLGRPGAQNLGMALAASVVLAAITVVVMGVAERARVAGRGDL